MNNFPHESNDIYGGDKDEIILSGIEINKENAKTFFRGLNTDASKYTFFFCYY